MKRIAFLFVYLFGVLYSGHCPKKQSIDHYYLTIKAIKGGNISDFEKNIKHIKNIDSLFHSDTAHSYTLLGYACLYQNKHIVQRLIEMKADMECVYSDDMYCYDALYMAVDKGNVELVKLFLSLGANANVAYNEDGLCPLVMSCSMNSYPVTCLLLQYGAKANGLGNLGGDYITYPLMVAVDKNNINMVKVLLKYGAKTKVKNRSGMSPLSIARHHKNVAMIKLLEKSR
ncbi:ankyrin repeat domain-containing protein [Prevotella melaninogenica]|uniref:ankyrin repeat domain-containing protein n=1 Tax=Prevotella melaninogenica TaxID=28132 RepID=UPI002012399B|nr:ankyrin repeat domain-containing protein [Prevotella melaninogenica]